MSYLKEEIRKEAAHCDSRLKRLVSVADEAADEAVRMSAIISEAKLLAFGIAMEQTSPEEREQATKDLVKLLLAAQP